MHNLVFVDFKRATMCIVLIHYLPCACRTLPTNLSSKPVQVSDLGLGIEIMHWFYII